jgi:aerobic carbon-monoxide dehydrogenase small subunit
VRSITLNINGESHQVYCESDFTLLRVLRAQLGLSGTKENCLEGECGVCTVLLDGKAVNSCLLLAQQCEHNAITTIEGLGGPESLHPLQAAFIKHGAVQCGYCIPGMILMAKSFIDELEGNVPSREEIREAIGGTLCRCTGYRKIVDAISEVAEESGKAKKNAAE